MHSRVKEERESCEQKEGEMLKEEEDNSTHYVA